MRAERGKLSMRHEPRLRRKFSGGDEAPLILEVVHTPPQARWQTCIWCHQVQLCNNSLSQVKINLNKYSFPPYPTLLVIPSPRSNPCHPQLSLLRASTLPCLSFLRQGQKIYFTKSRAILQVWATTLHQQGVPSLPFLIRFHQTQAHFF